MGFRGGGGQIDPPPTYSVEDKSKIFATLPVQLCDLQALLALLLRTSMGKANLF